MNEKELHATKATLNLFKAHRAGQEPIKDVYDEEYAWQEDSQYYRDYLNRAIHALAPLNMSEVTTVMTELITSLLPSVATRNNSPFQEVKFMIQPAREIKNHIARVIIDLGENNVKVKNYLQTNPELYLSDSEVLKYFLDFLKEKQTPKELADFIAKTTHDIEIIELPADYQVWAYLESENKKIFDIEGYSYSITTSNEVGILKTVSDAPTYELAVYDNYGKVMIAQKRQENPIESEQPGKYSILKEEVPATTAFAFLEDKLKMSFHDVYLKIPGGEGSIKIEDMVYIEKKLVELRPQANKGLHQNGVAEDIVKSMIELIHKTENPIKEIPPSLGLEKGNAK